MSFIPNIDHLSDSFERDAFRLEMHQGVNLLTPPTSPQLRFFDLEDTPLFTDLTGPSSMEGRYVSQIEDTPLFTDPILETTSNLFESFAPKSPLANKPDQMYSYLPPSSNIVLSPLTEVQTLENSSTASVSKEKLVRDKTDNKRKKLILCMLANPTMSNKELVKLPNFPYKKETGLSSALTLMRIEAEENHFIKRYKGPNLTEAQLTEFSRLVLKPYRPSISRDRELILTMLNNPSLSNKQLAEIESLECRPCTVSRILTRMREELKTNRFIDKYVCPKLIEEQLNLFIDTVLNNSEISTGSTTQSKFHNSKIEKRRNLILAILQHPSVSYKELATIPSVSYINQYTINKAVENMLQEHLEGIFIEKYKASNLGEPQLAQFIKLKFEGTHSHNSPPAQPVSPPSQPVSPPSQPVSPPSQPVSPPSQPASLPAQSVFLQKKPFLIQKKSVQKKRNLILAILQNPSMPYKEIATLPTVAYTNAAVISTLLNRMSQEHSEGCFIEKYKGPNLTEEQLTKFSKLKFNKLKLSEEEKIARKNKILKSVEDKRQLILAILQNPTLSYRQLAALPSVPYNCYQSIPRAVNRILAKIEQYRGSHLTDAHISEFKELIANKKNSKKTKGFSKPTTPQRKLILAVINNPGMSYDNLAKLPSAPYSNCISIQKTIEQLHCEYDQGIFFEKYSRKNLTEDHLCKFLELTHPKFKV